MVFRRVLSTYRVIIDQLWAVSPYIFANCCSVGRSVVPSSFREAVCHIRGLVICELRTGELIIYELIVRTTDANLGYNANQKVRTFYAITCLGITQYRNDFHNDSKRRKKPTQCTFYKNTTKLHVSVAAAIICTILGLCICNA